jgi:2-polyprenyl-6-methoxyphenol hydroxylase-like FAD-dependent oxidoreductase
MPGRYDVIVVGARSAGAPLAMLLARAGHRVLLVDRARFPSDTISTHWLLRPGVRLLASWGLLASLAASGCPPIEHVQVRLRDIVLSGVPDGTDGPAVTYAPRRTILDALLVDAARAAGCEVREGVSVRDVCWDDGTVTGVRGHDAGGQPWTERARLVVGADGRNSTIARTVGASLAEDRGALAATAYCYWSGLPADGAEVSIGERRGASCWPTHDGLTVLALTCPREEFLNRRQSTEQVYLRLLRQLPGIGDRLTAAVRESPVRAATNLRNFRRNSHGPGWALAGDAGHHMDPIGAHGISDAFTDAQALADAVHQGLTGAADMTEALAGYCEHRAAERAPTFDFTCQQASLQPPDGAFERLLRKVAGSTEATGDMLGVFAGGRPIQEFLSPASIARIMRLPQDRADQDRADQARVGAGTGVR